MMQPQDFRAMLKHGQLAPIRNRPLARTSRLVISKTLVSPAPQSVFYAQPGHRLDLLKRKKTLKHRGGRDAIADVAMPSPCMERKALRTYLLLGGQADRFTCPLLLHAERPLEQ